MSTSAIQGGREDDRRNGEGETKRRSQGVDVGLKSSLGLIYQILTERFLCATPSLGTYSVNKGSFNPYNKPVGWVR